MDNALQQREVDLAGLWRAHLRGKGRTGAPRSRLLLQAADGGARSAAERILHKAFEVDRRRQNDIVLLGWQVLRFTWLDLTAYPQRVVASIHAATSAR